ncbi:MAG: hypothetical protein DI536_18430 [Archangium gephyra]|uniref:Uncharacterized protein n=1 Tax=Archangium gephyra TaxID=48 RepID=A0A2W5TII4_9BACT|nr:MAG: hypothetical protein DI536_18430 [Archangium gephyra]
MLQVLIISIAAAPPIALVERPNDRAPAGAVQNVERRLRVAFEAKNVTVADGLAPCGEEKDCLFVHARRLRGIAVALSVVKGRKGVLVDLQATANDGLDVAAATFTLPGGDKVAPEIAPFVDKVATAWAALPEEKPAPPPEPETRLTEATAEVQPVVVLEQPKHTPVFANVTLGAGIVTGTAAIALGIVGAVLKGSLDSSLAMQPPVLTRPAALEQAALANGLFTASLISALVAGVSAVLFALFTAVGR